jgi:dTMP kinase
MAGKIIVIEGTDCSGKETQSKLLEKRLGLEGYKVKRFGFPMYETPTGKIVGGCYLGKPEICEGFFEEGATNVDPMVSCLYYAADRKYNYPKIEEYLKDDYYVILDRYTTSNLAHQGSKIKDKDERFNMFMWIDRLEYWLLGLPKADETILLHVSPETNIELSKLKEHSDPLEKNLEYLEDSEACYLELSELYNWKKIECMEFGKLRSIEDIQKDILEIVLKEEQ